MTRIIIGCFFRPFEAFVGHCPKFVGSSHRAVGRQLSLSGNSFNPCSQGTHDIGDASPGARFITSEILGRHRRAANRRCIKKADRIFCLHYFGNLRGGRRFQLGLARA